MDFFERLNTIKWFLNCGNEFTIEEFPFKLYFLRSLDEMAESIVSEHWENATLEARNRLTTFLHLNGMDSYSSDWNEVTISNKNRLATVSDMAEKFANKNNLGENFISSVRWDILGASMEDYYYAKNQNIPIFFKYLMLVYEKGNIPCGAALTPTVKNVWEWSQADFSKLTLLVH